MPKPAKITQGNRENPADSGLLTAAAANCRERIQVIADDVGQVSVVVGSQPVDAPWHVTSTLSPLYPEDLGGPRFAAAHGTRFAYVAGAMANGIATAELVIAMARAGCLGFFGAAGLDVRTTSAALDRIDAALHGTGLPWGSNLIHAPQEPDLERATAQLYLDRGVTRVSASAFMDLQPSVVQYAASGLREIGNGRVARRNHLFAKISRPEVAARFLAPPSQAMLDALVTSGALTAEEARLAAMIPVASDIIVESDSGGHTDNRPLGALFGAIATMAVDAAVKWPAAGPVRVGAAGGIGTPQSAAAAYAMGADFVLTGSVNQAAVESGLSEAGKEMLAQADLADVMMTAAADMFELGVKLQVLRRGTMFGQRANRLYTIYSAYDRWASVPAAQRKELETRVFGMPFDDVWGQTSAFWQARQPAELARASRDPRHKMALCFRWYLGKSSRWAIAGDDSRKMDWQIWCGPAMGAFNRWAKGSFLADPRNRSASQIALNILEGAAVITRARQLQLAGVAMPPAAFHFAPRPLH